MAPPPTNLEGWDIVACINPPKKIVGISPECRAPPPPPIINAELRHCLHTQINTSAYIYTCMCIHKSTHVSILKLLSAIAYYVDFRMQQTYALAG